MFDPHLTRDIIPDSYPDLLMTERDSLVLRVRRSSRLAGLCRRFLARLIGIISARRGTDCRAKDQKSWNPPLSSD